MKMKHAKIFMLLCLLLGQFSCQKELVSNDIGAVRFLFEGTIDGLPVNFQAGENNYYLYTNYRDAGSRDVLVMQGEFRDKADSSQNYLRFEFYGYDSVKNDDILANVFNQSAFYSLSQDSTFVATGLMQLNFINLLSNGGITFWDFGDGSTATGDSVMHTYSPNLQTVDVTMVSNNGLIGCVDSITNTINLADILNSQVQFDVATNPTFDSFALSASQGFTAYFWDFGNGQLGQGLNAIVMYTDSLKHMVELTATRPGISSSWRGILQNTSQPCLATFLFDIVSIPNTITNIRPPYKACVITYNTGGKTYSSYKNNGTDQSGKVVFNMNEAYGYDLNQFGQKTIGLQGTVNGFLYNVQNPADSIAIKGSSISITVAHP